MANDNSTVGKTSFGAAVLGIVSLSLAFLVANVVQEADLPAWQRAFAGLFAMGELAALGCGIAARGTAAGKTGLALSSVLLFVCSVTLFAHLHIR